MKTMGIDIGTTSICLACYESETGHPLLVLHRANRFLPGTFMQDPEEIIGKVEDMLREARQMGLEPETLAGIGISSQMHGILYLDRKGRAVSPLYTWKDERGKEIYADGVSCEAFLREQGLDVHSGYGIVTHFCLDRRGEIPADAVRFAGIGDYLAMRLTGRTEPLVDGTMAASFGGFSMGSWDFAREAMERAGIRTEFLPQVAPQTAAGQVAGRYGNVPVSCACGDNQASFFGAVEETGSQISVNVGTGSQVSMFLKALQDPQEGLELRPFLGGGCLCVGASLNGGKVYERLAAFFEETVLAFTGEKIQAYGCMERLAAEAEAEGMAVGPYLYGSRMAEADENAGCVPGGWVRGLTEQNFHPGNLICAYVRGMAEELYGLYQRFPREERAGKREIVASGNGMRKNPLLVKAVSDIFGLPVRIQEQEEEAAYGAARYAARLTKELGRTS